ncbi:MAG: hypothetical protein IPK35_06525 [Saprospiraceae bacterium]|nr:hypothetical protein [Saprospiraceae bacterium]
MRPILAAQEGGLKSVQCLILGPFSRTECSCDTEMRMVKLSGTYLNGSALALARIVATLLENHQDRKVLRYHTCFATLYRI